MTGRFNSNWEYIEGSIAWYARKSVLNTPYAKGRSGYLKISGLSLILGSLLKHAK